MHVLGPGGDFVGDGLDDGAALFGREGFPFGGEAFADTAEIALEKLGDGGHNAGLSVSGGLAGDGLDDAAEADLAGEELGLEPAPARGLLRGLAPCVNSGIVEQVADFGRLSQKLVTETEVGGDLGEGLLTKSN